MFKNSGIYSLSEVSKITCIKYPTLSNWVNKYLIKRTYKDEEDILLSFWDLIEILFIKNFIDSGVSRNKVFKAYIKAKNEINSQNPFAYNFTTDTNDIYAKYAYI